MQDEREGHEVRAFGQPREVEIVEFWRRFLKASGEDPMLPVPEPGAFGDTPELADELLALVLAGTKRATAGTVAEYVDTGRPFPKVGDRWIVTDGAMRPRVVLETTEVKIGPLSSVDEAFAADEGEGDGSRDDWLDAHTMYFSRTLARIGIDFHPHISVVFERFAVAYHE